MNLDHILVFKTDIQTNDQIKVVSQFLSSHPQIAEWNVDLEDRDNVLRIVSFTLSNNEICSLLQQNGYSCCELE